MPTYMERVRKEVKRSFLAVVVTPIQATIVGTVCLSVVGLINWIIESREVVGRFGNALLLLSGGAFLLLMCFWVALLVMYLATPIYALMIALVEARTGPLKIRIHVLCGDFLASLVVLASFIADWLDRSSVGPGVGPLLIPAVPYGLIGGIYGMNVRRIREAVTQPGLKYRRWPRRK